MNINLARSLEQLVTLRRGYRQATINFLAAFLFVVVWVTFIAPRLTTDVPFVLILVTTVAIIGGGLLLGQQWKLSNAAWVAYSDEFYNVGPTCPRQITFAGMVSEITYFYRPDGEGVPLRVRTDPERRALNAASNRSEKIETSNRFELRYWDVVNTSDWKLGIVFWWRISEQEIMGERFQSEVFKAITSSGQLTLKTVMDERILSHVKAVLETTPQPAPGHIDLGFQYQVLMAVRQACESLADQGLCDRRYTAQITCMDSGDSSVYWQQRLMDATMQPDLLVASVEQKEPVS